MAYNWLLSLSHRDSSPVLVNARPRTKDADFRRFGLTDRRSSFSSNAYTASGTTGGSFLGIIGDCPPLVDAGSPLNGRCVNDNTTAVTLQSKSQRDNVYSALTYDLGQGWEMFGDAALSRSRQASGMYSYATNSYGAYTNDLVDKFGLYGNAPGTTISYLLLPADHPQNQWGKTVGVRYVFNDIPTTINSESRNMRATLGARGTLGKWDVEGAAMFSRSLTDTSYRGYIQDKVLINDVLDANGLVRNSFLLHQPAKNDAGLMGRLYPQLDNHADTSTSSIDLHGNRELYTLPGGALSIAVGAEYRREKFDATPGSAVHRRLHPADRHDRLQRLAQRHRSVWRAVGAGAQVRRVEPGRALRPLQRFRLGLHAQGRHQMAPAAAAGLAQHVC